VTSEDGDGRLIQTNNTIKENLKTWLNSSRMINDTIDILDAKIVNIGIEFTAIADLEANKYDVLSAAVEELTSFYSRKFDVGEPFSITEVYSRLNKLDGIIDVSRVKIVHKSGVNYSPQAFNVNESYSDDGRYLIAPDNVIFEIKFPQNDIKGTIK
jgi:phage-related baseplate assembly protein